MNFWSLLETLRGKTRKALVQDEKIEKQLKNIVEKIRKEKKDKEKQTLIEHKYDTEVCHSQFFLIWKGNSFSVSTLPQKSRYLFRKF